MKNNLLNQFVVFIITNGRPEKVFTYKTLKKSGYTGKIVLIVDDLDKTKNQYLKQYGSEVYIFDKNAIAQTFDNGDNSGDLRSIIFGRNACFSIARQLGYKYFIQLDDDYQIFEKRFNKQLQYLRKPERIDNLDHVFVSFLKFFDSTNINSIAFAQGGDFIGGASSSGAKKITLMRKCMNSFICSVDRPFQFIGRLNEDVNTYCKLGNIGQIFFTSNLVSLVQKQTQSNAGGLTEVYKDLGTYVKSFFTILYQPSSVKIKLMGGSNKRIHHAIEWRYTVPKILDEKFKK